MLEIDKYAYQSRLSPVAGEWKFLGYVLILIGIFAATIAIRLGCIVFFMLITPYIVRISIRRYLKWLTLPLGFLIFSLVGLVFSFSHSPDHFVWQWSISDWYVGIDSQSLAVAYETLSRSLAALTVTYLFILTTPFDQLIRLMKRSHLPKVLIEQLLLTYRFIFIVLEEASSIYQAQSLRFGYYSKRNWLHSLSLLVTMLLERVLDRYKIMQVALNIKLYQGEFHL